MNHYEKFADAQCAFAEFNAIIDDPGTLQERINRSFPAKYKGKDCLDGTPILPGEKITRLGNGWTHLYNFE